MFHSQPPLVIGELINLSYERSRPSLAWKGLNMHERLPDQWSRSYDRGYHAPNAAICSIQFKNKTDSVL